MKRRPMDKWTVLGLAALAVLLYLGQLLIRERGDFEAHGRSGPHEISVKAKQKRW
jgi:hypothetical protein